MSIIIIIIIIIILNLWKSGTSVGITTGLGRTAGVQFPVGKHFSLIYSVQTVSRILGTGGSFPGIKTAGV
jgi:hypothetical protein